MAKFYFTFGDDESYPFKGGWVTIEAPTKEIACGVFNAIYPNNDREHDGMKVLNCADIYTEDRFSKTWISRAGKLGAFCHAEYHLVKKHLKARNGV